MGYNVICFYYLQDYPKILMGRCKVRFIKAYTQIFESKDLNGLTGDNGETICLFVRDTYNPLNSGWKWFFTKDAAGTYQNELIKNNPDINKWY